MSCWEHAHYYNVEQSAYLQVLLNLSGRTRARLFIGSLWFLHVSGARVSLYVPFPLVLTFEICLPKIVTVPCVTP